MRLSGKQRSPPLTLIVVATKPLVKAALGTCERKTFGRVHVDSKTSKSAVTLCMIARRVHDAVDVEALA